MASLTPGVLSKLLENAGNRVTGEHRKALLQVTEIVPRLSEDTWQPSKGYFLKLSDSLHSAYVSVSDSDAELIRSDKLRLGQFVYVTRLDSDSASPVPFVRGLNPLPKRRPCVGNPIDLVSSDSLHVLTPSTPTQSSKTNNNNNVMKKKKKNGPVSGSESPSKGNKNKNKNNPMVVEMRRLSLDSARRVWDHNPVAQTKTSSASSSSRFNLKSTSTSPNVIEKKVSSLKTDSPLKSPTSMVSPLKNKNENFILKTTGTPPRKSVTKSPGAGNNVLPEGLLHNVVPSQLVKVPLNLKTWCDDKSANWEDLPTPMCNLGKQVVTHRNVAFLAAVRSLEEASAADTVLQCMCLFDELCRSCQTLSAGLLVKQFMELHMSLQRVTVIFDSLLATPPETKPSRHTTLQCLVEDACKVPSRKNAISWVQAALGTNLSKFNLFRTQEKSEVLNGEKCHYVVIDNSREEMNTEESATQNKQSRVTQANLLQNSTGKRLSSSKRNLLVAKNKDTEKQDQSKESELKVAASLAEKLIVASREWFLKYLEESLGNEFGLKNEGSTEVACLLGQLKKVNHWLDNLIGGDKVDHRVENLRKSLYRFLLEHVNSAVASS